MSEVILSLKEITKLYPGVVALDRVSIDFHKGEVHALLGENGAGKSTLIKIVSGAVAPDGGTIGLQGKQYGRLDPSHAKKLGVEVIYQEFNLVESLTVAENVCLGERFGKLVSYAKMRGIAQSIFAKMGVNVPVNALVRELPASQQQLVEIAKAISREAGILIMDEPSAPLSLSEVQKMFDIVRLLRDSGVTIIYISHRMDEIFEIADRVSVLRDGRFIRTLKAKETNSAELIRLMVGRELSESYPKKECTIGEEALRLVDVSGNGDENINLTLHKGEILGLAGLVGAGRTELARLIFGADPLEGGKIIVHDQEVHIRLPSDAADMGIGLIPEDRKQQGCFLEKPIDWNITIASLKRLSKGLLTNKKREADLSRHFIRMFNIRTPGSNQLVKNLSGGNQQKVVIAKTIATNSEILIFDEPTRGIDVGAKQEIYQMMCNLACQGKAILMITSDMAELLGMSDRIIVLARGRIAGELTQEPFSQIHVLELASGLTGSDEHNANA